MAQVPSLENLLQPLSGRTCDSTLLESITSPRSEKQRAGDYSLPAPEKTYVGLTKAEVTLPSFGEMFAQYVPRSPENSPPSSPGSPELVSSPQHPSHSPSASESSYLSEPRLETRPVSQNALHGHASDNLLAYVPMDMDSSEPSESPIVQRHPSPPASPTATPLTSTAYLQAWEHTAYTAIHQLLVSDAEFRRQLLEKVASRASIWRQSMWHTVLDLAPVVLNKIVDQLEALYVIPQRPSVKPDQEFHYALKYLVKQLIVGTTL
ncbi:hypothetical protein IWQ62_000021 [Dispira parvispora]|uniref:Uncharacterized protein n=1 Tax=Dispira parvispora TaxID=1520584 RepID=A0A9W8AVB0_9FUNG|nr:hypothetical protein IWQ62_000021 [Dispira parvispora]